MRTKLELLLGRIDEHNNDARQMADEWENWNTYAAKIVADGVELGLNKTAIRSMLPKAKLKIQWPDDPAALAQEQVEERAAQGAVTTRITPPSGQINEALASLHAPKSDEMPPIPPNLDRRKTA